MSEEENEFEAHVRAQVIKYMRHMADQYEARLLKGEFDGLSAVEAVSILIRANRGAAAEMEARYAVPQDDTALEKAK